jgi:hypothetical protein
VSICLNGKNNVNGTEIGGTPMTNGDTWYEPVELLSRCSLNEGLLWVWADRVPVLNIYREKNAFENLQDWECKFLSIPPVPSGMRAAAQYFTEKRLRSGKYGKMSADIREFQVTRGMEEAKALRQWWSLVTAAMELPATEMFLKLRRGQITAQGKLLPAGVKIIDFLEEQNSYARGEFDDLVDSVISEDFWTMPGIDWLSNAVTARDACYCDVSVPVEDLMTLFPGNRIPVGCLCPLKLSHYRCASGRVWHGSEAVFGRGVFEDIAAG